ADVRLVDRITVVRAELRAEELVLEELVDRVLERPVVLVGQVRLRARVVDVVVPVVADRTADAAPGVVGALELVLGIEIRAAGFLGRIDVLEQLQRLARRIPEETAAVDVRFPEVRTAAEADRAQVVEHVAVKLGVVVEFVFDVEVAGARAIGIEDRRIARCVLAAAVVASTRAELIIRRAAVQIRNAGAGAGTRIIVMRAAVAEIEIFIEERTRAVAQRRVRVGERRLREVAVVAPDRLLVAELEAEGHVEVAEGLATEELQALVVAAATRVAAGAQVELVAVDLVLEDDVDDARDR